MDVHTKKNGAEDAGTKKECGQARVRTAIDAKTRLLVHCFVGDRTEESASAFLLKLGDRLSKEKPLFTSDELKSYATVLKELYHEMTEQRRTGKPGRPRNPKPKVHEDLDYAVVHKTRVRGRVVKVERKVVYGNEERIAERLVDSPSRTINTSYVERLNGILRQLDAHLRRKALTFAKIRRSLNAKLNLTAAIYNFVRPHGTLSKNPDHSTTHRTPAMAAGITGHVWSAEELVGMPQACND